VTFNNDSGTGGYSAFIAGSTNTTETTSNVAIPVYTKEYDMDNQEIQYEFATNTYITVNSLAKNSYTDKMYADFKRLINFAKSLKISDVKTLEEYYSGPPNNLSGDDLTNAVNKQLSDETALMNAALHDRFNNMLYLLERHAADVTEEHTEMGSRMLRLDLLQVRLEEDEVTYTDLMSKNEDTNLPWAIMQKSNAEAALQASLTANAKIMQLSLANYI
jgi:flagellar hook-associated protein 3 FlgL